GGNITAISLRFSGRQNTGRRPRRAGRTPVRAIRPPAPQTAVNARRSVRATAVVLRETSLRTDRHGAGAGRRTIPARDEARPRRPHAAGRGTPGPRESRIPPAGSRCPCPPRRLPAEGLPPAPVDLNGPGGASSAGFLQSGASPWPASRGASQPTKRGNLRA